MGNITDRWEPSKGKGKSIPPSILTGEWQVLPAAGAEPLSEEAVKPPLNHSVDGAVTSYSDTPRRWVPVLLTRCLTGFLSPGLNTHIPTTETCDQCGILNAELGGNEETA